MVILSKPCTLPCIPSVDVTAYVTGQKTHFYPVDIGHWLPRYKKTVTIPGQISSKDNASNWMPMNGRNPLKMSVSVISGGATDFR